MRYCCGSTPEDEERKQHQEDLAARERTSENEARIADLWARKEASAAAAKASEHVTRRVESRDEIEKLRIRSDTQLTKTRLRNSTKTKVARIHAQGIYRTAKEDRRAAELVYSAAREVRRAAELENANLLLKVRLKESFCLPVAVAIPNQRRASKERRARSLSVG